MGKYDMHPPARSMKVTLPCRMGDLVWGIHRFPDGQVRVYERPVTDMYFGDDMRLCIKLKSVALGEWGKEIFPTEAAARAAAEKLRYFRPKEGEEG